MDESTKQQTWKICLLQLLFLLTIRSFSNVSIIITMKTKAVCNFLLNTFYFWNGNIFLLMGASNEKTQGHVNMLFSEGIVRQILLFIWGTCWNNLSLLVCTHTFALTHFLICIYNRSYVCKLTWSVVFLISVIAGKKTDRAVLFFILSWMVLKCCVCPKLFRRTVMLWSQIASVCSS